MEGVKGVQGFRALGVLVVSGFGGLCLEVRPFRQRSPGPYPKPRPQPLLVPLGPWTSNPTFEGLGCAVTLDPGAYERTTKNGGIAKALNP